MYVENKKNKTNYLFKMSKGSNFDLFAILNNLKNVKLYQFINFHFVFLDNDIFYLNFIDKT